MNRMSKVVGLLGFLGLSAASTWAADAPAAYDKKCKTCHSVGGVGGPMAKMGGPVDGVGAKRDEAWLREFLKDPKSKMPEAKMPKVTLSTEDTDAVIAYLLSLK